MKHISELDPNNNTDLLKIVMLCKGLNSERIQKFTKKELQDWLFPIAMENPVLAKHMITYYDTVIPVL